MQIALIADSHLSARAPECVANWNAAARAVAAADPDLTIHLGDITLDACEQPEELSFARGLVQAWPTPMMCVPGGQP
jgi:predicted phosphodiesterase